MDRYFDDEKWIAAHYGEEPSKYMGAVVPPVFLNSLHVFPSQEALSTIDRMQEDSFVYGRCSNPTVRLVEKKIAAMEHGKTALCFSSGMAAATTAVTAVCNAGDHVVCVRNAYPPLKAFLTKYCVKKMGMEVTFIPGEKVEEFADAIRENTKLFILESPSSIVFSLQDIRAVTALAKAHGIRTYIDNTYCSPVYQKPLDMGVDLVMHTLSKYLGGHSDVIGGVLVSNNEELMKEISCDIREWLGGILGPMEGWLVLRGMRTLQTRIVQHEQNAKIVAEFLEKHPRVKKVYYPGLKSHPQYELMKSQQTGNGGLLSFETDLEVKEMVQRVNQKNLNVFQIGVSWGGFESLIDMPFWQMSEEETMTQFGANPGIIRIYCGLEGAELQIQDLERLLNN